MISTEQFLDLNEGIGGSGRRREADPATHGRRPDRARRRLSHGRILFGGAGLAGTPIIDYRSYSEDAANGDIHMITHGYATRARLEAANGDAHNQVFLIEDGRYGGFSLTSPTLRYALTSMDAWLTALRPRRLDPAVAPAGRPQQTGRSHRRLLEPGRHAAQDHSAAHPGQRGGVRPAVSRLLHPDAWSPARR